MTRAELFKLHQLKGRLDGQAFCLESDITSGKMLLGNLVTEVYQKRVEGQLEVLERWKRDNTRLREEVERIIKEAENDRQ